MTKSDSGSAMLHNDGFALQSHLDERSHPDWVIVLGLPIASGESTQPCEQVSWMRPGSAKTPRRVCFDVSTSFNECPKKLLKPGLHLIGRNLVFKHQDAESSEKH